MVTQNDSADYPMLVYPRLALALGGSNEAIFVAQVHYWISKNGHFRPEDGQYWIWNSIDDWLRQFIWMSRNTLKRLIQKLEKLGVLLSDQPQKDAWNHTKWYRLDYAKLVENGWNPCKSRSTQNGPIVSYFKELTIDPKWVDRSTQNGPIDRPKMGQSSLATETTPETTSKRKEALLKNFEEEQEEEDTHQPLATLEVKPKPAGEEPKISGEDRSSAAPTEIKAVLGALFSGSAQSSDRPQREERPCSIPVGYFEEVTETLSKHQHQLEKLGIDLGNETLQDIINGHPHNLEPAIEAFFERCSKGAIDHPERYLNAAVRQGWRARNQGSTTEFKSPLTPEFLEAYQQLCDCGFVEPVEPRFLLISMGEPQVQIRMLNPRPGDPPYQNMPWRKALAKATAAGLLSSRVDDW